MTNINVAVPDSPLVSSPSIEDLLARMWSDYVTLNPMARRIHQLLEDRGERVVNDHIALRTFDLAPVSLDVLARPFLERGYVERGAYEFPAKKLAARHFEPPRVDLPKIFISEIRVASLPPPAAALIADLVAAVPAELPLQADFCVSGRSWPLSSAQYRELREASDYAAWVAAFGFRPNHFTVDVNALRTFASLADLNAFLKRHGFALNDSGGEIKGGPEELLEQSSTIANLVDVELSDGVHPLPACYYELARRYPGPDGGLYQGFIAASADKIFESTSRGQ